MPDHALYCIDSPLMTGDTSEAGVITGWFLYVRHIDSIKARLAGHGMLEAAYGLPRPDVKGSTFAPYPNAGRCGFSIKVPAGSIDKRTRIDMTLSIRGKFKIAGRKHLTIGLADNSIQRVHLSGRRHMRGMSSGTLEREMKNSLAKKPGITLRLDIINKCNLRCVMCHYADDSVFMRPVKKLTVRDFERFFGDISPCVRSIILSCADEPLTSKDFPEILSYIAEKYPHVEIEFCTNGMLMSAGIRGLIIEKGVTCIMVSLDGVLKKTVESIRVGARYETIVGNLLALRDLRQDTSSRFPVLIMDYVMMDGNIHEAPAYVELAARLGAEVIDFRHAIPSPVFDDPENFLSSHASKYNYYRQRIIQEGKRHEIDIVLPPPYQTTESFSPDQALQADLHDFEKVIPDAAAGELPVPRTFPKRFNPRRTRGTAARLFARTYCERPFSEITILDQDLVKPCPWHRSHLGKLSDGHTLSEIFFGEAFQQLRKNMLDPEGDPNCQGCPWKTDLLIGRITQYESRIRKLGHKIMDPLEKLTDFF